MASTTPLQVKIGNFGITKSVRENDSTVLRTQVQALSYAAPEVVNMNHTKPESMNAVDMWSLGCITYEMLAAGEKLFPTLTMYHRYCEGRSDLPIVPLQSRGLDSSGIEFLRSLITIDIEHRMDIWGDMAHPWPLENDSALL